MPPFGRYVRNPSVWEGETTTIHACSSIPIGQFGRIRGKEWAMRSFPMIESEDYSDGNACIGR